MEKIEDIIQHINSGQENKSNMEIRKYLKHWQWFLVCVIIGVSLSYFLFKNSPVTYEVNSRILAQEENQEIKSILSFTENSVTAVAQNNIENRIGVLHSFAIFKETLLRLNWTSSWYQKELLFKRELYENIPFEIETAKNAQNVPNIPLEIVALNENEYKIYFEGQIYKNGYRDVIINETAKFGEPYSNDYFSFTLNPSNGKIGQPYYLIFNNINTLANIYLHKTIVSSTQMASNLITITIKGTNVYKETDFINELTQVFIDFEVESKNQSSTSSLNFIDTQIARIKAQLKTAEEESSNFRANKQAVNLTQEAQIVSQRLEEIDNEKYMLQLQLDYYNNLQQYIDKADEISKMVNPSVVGINDDNLKNRLDNLVELYAQRELLSVSVKEKSPSFVKLQKEIQTARDGINETLKIT